MRSSSSSAPSAHHASSPGASGTAPRIVVVGAGLDTSLQRPDSAHQRAARRLARNLGLPHHLIDDPWTPRGELRRLQASPEGWLASLPLDPGQPLADGGTWAEALGAWRQPALLIIAGHQLASGAAASSVALLRQWRAPLMGVAQWGGRWNADQRRRDGLPWLGPLAAEARRGGEAPADGEERVNGEAGETRDDGEDLEDRRLGALLIRRWRALDHAWSNAVEA
jgi:hypothetical protein